MKTQDDVLARRKRAAEEYQRRLVAAQSTQVAAMTQMLMEAFKELRVLDKRPNPELNEINLVAHRHAKKIISVMNGNTKL